MTIEKEVYRASVIIILALLSLTATHALQTFPTQTQVTDYLKQQSFVMTILNDGPRTEDITMMVDPYSAYLEEYLLVEPRAFRLAPNSRKNIELTLSMPATLSPETHRLRVMPVTRDEIGPAADLIFSVPGEARHDLSVSEVKAGDITAGEPVIIDIFLNNKGNVIAMATPTITINNASGTVAEIESRSIIQIMPRSSYNISLRHELLDAVPGAYIVAVSLAYNGGELVTEERTAAFNVEESEEDEVSREWLWPIAAAGAFILASLAIWAARREPSRAKRAKALSKRITKLEKEISRMVLETDTFVRSSNHWLDERFGEGNYEFR